MFNLAELIESYNRCEKEVHDIECNIQNELEKQKKLIYAKYKSQRDEKRSNLEEYRNKLKNHIQTIEVYSHFDISHIGTVIAEIISIFEGKTFRYQEAINYIKSEQGFYFNKEGFMLRKGVRLVISDECRCSSYSKDEDNDLEGILKKSEALVLVDDVGALLNKKDMYFYYSKNPYLCLESKVNYGRFLYIKEFIDDVILYKIEHNVLRISLDELERLKDIFLFTHKNEILENFDEKSDELKRITKLNSQC